MTTHITHVSILLDRRLLEHPRGLHVRRMREGIWLYLALLARLGPSQDTVAVDTGELARGMGLPDGMIRSALGHLRKHRYVEIVRVEGRLRVRVRGLPPPAPTEPKPAGPPRAFTVAKLARALGEKRDTEALEQAIGSHTDDVIRRALAAVLKVPSDQIRRSRTALFLFLLKKHAHEDTQDDSRD
ncbi:MAG: hypothetical protein KDB18_01620 [Salinibacterium sp.]|nr:hypothetical protein [Salinibacterium sp.]